MGILSDDPGEQARRTREWNERLDSIPAVAPDDELEDTIRRIHESSGFLPAFPGYQSRDGTGETNFSEYHTALEAPTLDSFDWALKTASALAWTGLGVVIGYAVFG